MGNLAGFTSGWLYWYFWVIVVAFEAIAGAILETVQEAIARQEGPELVYVEEGGENPFLVYGRAGERCPRCKRGTIRRFVQAQRATFHCPRCQR